MDFLPHPHGGSRCHQCDTRNVVHDNDTGIWVEIQDAPDGRYGDVTAVFNEILS